VDLDPDLVESRVLLDRLNRGKGGFRS